MMSDSEELDNFQELREEMLLQLLAVFLRRFGGEVTISQREFGMVEGLEVFAQHTTPEHLTLRLEELDITVELDDEEGPEEPS